MSDDQTRVDLGGGMVVPLRELIDDDGFDFDDLPENDEDLDCTICGGEGYDDCADPIQCFAPHTDGGLCPCIAAAFAAGLIVGLRVNARRLATLRELLRSSEARHDAWNPAVFAWETDGFPFAACNLCVELWFPDGLPDHVTRLDQPSSEVECNIGGGTSTPDEANAILHPVEWVHLRCGFCGHWERGQFTKEQVAEWLRIHRDAMVGPNEGHTTTASTCPHPCGTPLPQRFEGYRLKAGD